MKLHLLFMSLLAALPSTFSEASSYNIPPMSTFTQSASNILRGSVSNVHTENTITDGGQKAIYTYANFDIKENLKGSIRSTSISIRKMGGTRDGSTLEVPGTPNFIEGEDIVLYLGEPTEDRSFEVIGMELGKFDIADKNGEATLAGGILAYSHAETNEPGHEHPAIQGQVDISENLRPWSLKDLRNLIQKQSSSAPNSPSSALTSTSSSPNPLVSISPPSPVPSITISSESPYEAGGERTSPVRAPYIFGIIIGVAAFFVFRKRK